MENVIAQKMKFFIKDFFSKRDPDLITFTKEILNGKLHFLRRASFKVFGYINK